MWQIHIDPIVYMNCHKENQYGTLEKGYKHHEVPCAGLLMINDTT